MIVSLPAEVCMACRKYIPLGAGHERVGVSKKAFDLRIETGGLTKKSMWKKLAECSKPCQEP